jgi:hypothetical protein
MPPSAPKKSELDGKPVTRRRKLSNKRAKATNGAAMANGHDVSATVQLQDIQEQQDSMAVVGEKSASQQNGHADTAGSVPIPTTPVVPKVADKGEETVKKIDWEIPRKSLHSSIGSCSPSVASMGSC